MIYVVLALCALASLACAALLLRGWRRSRVALLLSCAICFAGMAISHVLRIVERANGMEGSQAFGALVQAPTLIGIVVLIWGLVKASE